MSLGVHTYHVEGCREKCYVVEVYGWNHIHQHREVDSLLQIHTLSHGSKHEEDAFYSLKGRIYPNINTHAK